VTETLLMFERHNQNQLMSRLLVLFEDCCNEDEI
jgi:hypothetical protein